jgi:hypothetical protein
VNSLNAFGWRDPSKPAPGASLTLILACELGDEVAAKRFSEAAERANEPRFFGEHSDDRQSVFSDFYQLPRQWAFRGR